MSGRTWTNYILSVRENNNVPQRLSSRLQFSFNCLFCCSFELSVGIFCRQRQHLTICAASIRPMIGAMFKRSRFGQKPLEIHTIIINHVWFGAAAHSLHRRNSALNHEGTAGCKEFPKQGWMELWKTCGWFCLHRATERQHVAFHALRSQNAPAITQAMGCEWVGR